MNWILVFLGGGFGSLLRYSISHFFHKETLSFPWPTFIANLLSCFLVGCFTACVAKYSLNENVKILFISGFCGGFSTFSALSYETLVLLQAGKIIQALTYTFLSISIGLSCIILGSKLNF
jgi:CrcB protein